VVSAWLQRTVGICFVQDQHLVQENFFSKVRKDNYGDKSKCAKRFIQGKREGGVQSHQEAADLLHACRNDWRAHLFFVKSVSDNVSASTFLMMAVMMPLFFMAMYEKNGETIERIIQHAIDWKRRKPTPEESFEQMFKDGICRVDENYYSKTIRFLDINYKLATDED